MPFLKNTSPFPGIHLSLSEPVLLWMYFVFINLFVVTSIATIPLFLQISANWSMKANIALFILGIAIIAASILIIAKTQDWMANTSASLDRLTEFLGYSMTNTKGNSFEHISKSISHLLSMTTLKTDEKSSFYIRVLELVNTIDRPMIVLNDQNEIVLLNGPAQQMTGRKSSDAFGLGFDKIAIPTDKFTSYPITSGKPNFVWSSTSNDVKDCIVTAKDGSQYIAKYKVTNLSRSNTDIFSSVVSFHSIEEFSTGNSELFVTTDGTDTPSHSDSIMFEQSISSAITEARQNDIIHTTCYIDLDQFKVIIQTNGRSAGNQLLKEVSGLIRDSIRCSDTLVHLRADEFGLVLRGCTIDQAEKAANSILSNLDNYRFHWGERVYSVSATIGMVQISAESTSAESVLIDAEHACYVAKQQGGHRICKYQEDNSDLVSSRKEMTIVDKINRALDDQNFVLYTQTIQPCIKSKLSKNSFEVLVRMLDIDGQLLLPGAFLPAAERYNLAPKIDLWVVKNTLDWLRLNPKKALNSDCCFINLSGRSIADPRFLENVTKILAESTVPPNTICFEITETATISNLDHAINFMTALKRTGCRFALDDFGTGLSSFAYLKQLPVDFLKIDGLFVRGILDNSLDLAFVKSINDIGQTMGMKTIAEFVENDKIMHQVEQLGVNFAQGYGIAHPQPIETALAT